MKKSLRRCVSATAEQKPLSPPAGDLTRANAFARHNPLSTIGAGLSGCRTALGTPQRRFEDGSRARAAGGAAFVSGQRWAWAWRGGSWGLGAARRGSRRWLLA
eukprot:3338549-Prymnesium_polylepis.1